MGLSYVGHPGHVDFNKMNGQSLRLGPICIRKVKEGYVLNLLIASRTLLQSISHGGCCCTVPLYQIKLVCCHLEHLWDAYLISLNHLSHNYLSEEQWT